MPRTKGQRPKGDNYGQLRRANTEQASVELNLFDFTKYNPHSPFGEIGDLEESGEKAYSQIIQFPLFPQNTKYQIKTFRSIPYSEIMDETLNIFNKKFV
jgi:hypothetical protein